MLAQLVRALNVALFRVGNDQVTAAGCTFRRRAGSIVRPQPSHLGFSVSVCVIAG